MKNFRTVFLSFLFATFPLSSSASPPQNDPMLGEKTLIVWVAPEHLDQQGGSALSVNNLVDDQFDAIVFGELTPEVWMPGSHGFHRTPREQADWPRETLTPGRFVQLAVVYKEKELAFYRDGILVSKFPCESLPRYRTAETIIRFGQRHHHHNGEFFAGTLRDARIYAAPLDQKTIVAMKPGEPVAGVTPWAWWDFATTGAAEKTGRFNRVEFTEGAAVEGGLLVLRDGGRMTATHDDGRRVWKKHEPVPDAVLRSTRLFREKLVEDNERAGYHFNIPEDRGDPIDVNGCFYADGRYHVMYLYERTGEGFCWGHVSSTDLVHWRHHPDAMVPGGGDQGCFSGGAFLDDDGTAYLTYWMLQGAKGVGMARSNDKHFDRWQKFPENPVIRSMRWGITEWKNPDGSKTLVGSADPTNIWKKNGKYYMCCGNLMLLNQFGRKPDAPESMKGDHLYLFESENLKDWRYKGEFYERNPAWTEASEDNMCPNFLPLPSSPDGGKPSGKHLLMFISHNKGAQYYIGRYDETNDRFVPESHDRWNSYSAPEAMIDAKGRQIAWACLGELNKDVRGKGWCGTYSLPLTLWLGEDGTLRMRPVPELERLRYNGNSWNDILLDAGRSRELENFSGDSCELRIDITPTTAKRVGVKVRVSPDGTEETKIFYDTEKKVLAVDTTRSGPEGWRVVKEAPLVLAGDEPLRLRVFLDKSIVDVYANDRQTIMRRVWPARKDSLGIVLFAEEGEARFSNIHAWEMMPSNPY